MLKLAYVVLAHENAQLVADQVMLLLEADRTGHVVVHYDARVPRKEFETLQSKLASSPRALLVTERVKCEWGRFSLVEAVIRALRLIRDRQLKCDYIYLLSSTCVPIKPIAKLKRFLGDSHGMEFIEAFSASWVKSGLREERYTSYHWFSWRTHRKLFDVSVFLQRLLRVKRRAPRGLTIRFGSQWWCLSSKTCFGILDFIAKYPRAYRFFRTTWIPDEIFFATLAAKIAGEGSIAQKHLTYFLFTPKGRPVSFYDDHGERIWELPFFFARKVSPTAHGLRLSLKAIASLPDDQGEMPHLDSSRSNFRYDQLLSRNVDFAKPGQIFYGGQAFTGWPSSLGSYPGVFGVLHGPPDVTRAIGRRLEQHLQVTLLGRIFHPDKVDLYAAGEEFAGFSAGDNKIRDMDRALYLSRLLHRARGFPIIEMTPGDETNAEWYFHQSPNVVFMPCVPANTGDDDARRLYWLLCASGFPTLSAIRPYEMRDLESFAAVRPFIDAYIARVFRPSQRKWMNDAIFLQTRSRRMMPIRWGVQNLLRAPIYRKLADELQVEFGPVISPLISVLPTIEFELRHGAGRGALDRFPPSWVRLFERYFVDHDNQTSSAPIRESAGAALTDQPGPGGKRPETGP